MDNLGWMIHMLIKKINHTATGKKYWIYGDHYMQPSDEEIMI